MVLAEFFSGVDKKYEYGKIFPYHYGKFNYAYPETMYVIVHAESLDFEEGMEFIQSP